jgi:hypothetical protein
MPLRRDFDVAVMRVAWVLYYAAVSPVPGAPEIAEYPERIALEVPT